MINLIREKFFELEKIVGLVGIGSIRLCLVGRKFSVFCIQTFRKQ